MAQFPGQTFAPSGFAAFHAPTHMSDPAFEPHSNFAFDDGDHHFGHLDQDMTSFDKFDDEVASHSSFGKGGDHTAHRKIHINTDTNHFASEPVSAVSAPEFWAVEHAPLGVSPHSAQIDIASKRSDSVNHHYGQLTPPDDGSLPALPGTAMPGESTASASVLLNPKSERARNAANQRHAKAKKLKLEHQVDAASPLSDGMGSSGGRREKYREKNRLAAAKCRAKKKTNVEDLEDRARQATARNSQLKLQARELRDAFTELRSHALMHDASQGCRCSQIHQYNAHKAQEAARGAITLPAFLCASMPGHDAFGSSSMGPPPAPTMSSLDSSDRVSRTQSFSFPSQHQQHQQQQQQHTAHAMQAHARSQSFADIAQFLQDSASVDLMQQDNAVSDLSMDEE